LILKRCALENDFFSRQRKIKFSGHKTAKNGGFYSKKGRMNGFQIAKDLRAELQRK
jgi:hypothetical protein